MAESIETSSVDTIVAVSTPQGRGGIGIVRLSGPQALGIAKKLVRLSAELEHGRARFARVVDANDVVMDEAVVTAYAGPNSYTGGDVAQ